MEQALETSTTGILTGPTGAGKSALALEIAKRHDLEIINADSLLVYRGLDIGTAKPSRDELASVRHHLIDVRELSQGFTAGDFYREANRALLDIHARGKRALIVGGSGFYLKALLYGLWSAPPTDANLRKELATLGNEALYQELFAKDEKAALRIGQNDHYRLTRAIEILRLGGKTPTQLDEENRTAAETSKSAAPRFLLWVMDRENADLFERINARTSQMIKNGLLDETLQAQTRYPTARALQAVGYAQCVDWLSDRKPKGRKTQPGHAGLEAEIFLATRQLVKRQRTWFRSQLKRSGWQFLLPRDLDALNDAVASCYTRDLT